MPGSRSSSAPLAKAPYDLAEHLYRRRDYFTDGQILEAARVLGTGPAAQSRRIVYQYRCDRQERDNRNINAMVDEARGSPPVPVASRVPGLL